MEVRVENRGGLNLFIQSVRTNNPVFGLPNPAGFGNFNIGPGQFWIAPITFRPTRESTFTGNLVIRSNDPDEPVVRVRLQGRTVVRLPELEVTPPSLDFGELFVDDVARDEIHLRNTGNQALSIDSITISAPEFTLLGGTTVSFILAPGDQRSLELSFTPPAQGLFRAVVEVRSNDPGQPTKRVPLVGTGVQRPIDFAVDAFPGLLRLIPGRVARLRYRIEELANLPLVVRSDTIILELSDGRSLGLAAQSIRTNLAAGETLEVDDSIVLPLELYDLDAQSLEGATLSRVFVGTNQGATLQRQADVEVSVTGSLGAEFEVTTVTIDYPFESTTIASGELLRARVLVFGTGTGTALGTVLVDGIPVESFVVELLNGRSQEVDLLNALPTGRVGSHTVQVEVLEPHRLRSQQVQYLVTPRAIEAMRFLRGPGVAHYLEGGQLPLWSWTPRAGADGYRVLIDDQEVGRPRRSSWNASDSVLARLDQGEHAIEVQAVYDERRERPPLRLDSLHSTFRWLRAVELVTVQCADGSCSWPPSTDTEPLFLLVVEGPSAILQRRATSRSTVRPATLFSVVRSRCASGCSWRVEVLNDLGEIVARSPALSFDVGNDEEANQ